MSTRRVSFALAMLATFACARSTHAAGFGLYEASARGNAMGGALVGDTGDASANYFNPANMTDLSGTHTLLGATAIHPVLDITANGEKNNLDSGWFAPPHAYVTTSSPTTGSSASASTQNSVWARSTTATGT